MQSRVRLGATPRAATSLAINCPPTFSLPCLPRNLLQVGPRSPPITTKLRNIFQILPPPPMLCDLKPAVHTSNSAVTAPFPRKWVSYSGPISGSFSGSEISLLWLLCLPWLLWLSLASLYSRQVLQNRQGLLSRMGFPRPSRESVHLHARPLGPRHCLPLLPMS